MVRGLVETNNSRNDSSCQLPPDLGNVREDPLETTLGKQKSKKAKARRAKATGFLAGLFVGWYLAESWRPLLKGGIKLGVQAGEKLKELSQKAAEEFEDISAEVSESLASEGQEVGTGSAPDADTDREPG